MCTGRQAGKRNIIIALQFTDVENEIIDLYFLDSTTIWGKKQATEISLRYVLCRHVCSWYINCKILS